jgi:hypothetical protein
MSGKRMTEKELKGFISGRYQEAVRTTFGDRGISAYQCCSYGRSRQHATGRRGIPYGRGQASGWLREHGTGSEREARR